MAAGITIVRPDLKPVAAKIAAAEKVLGSNVLYKAFGVATVGWIGQTFREGGRPKWKPLTPWTMAGRREGKGNKSPQPLQNNGNLRRSINYRLTNDGCVVYSDNIAANPQQFGTKGPYIICAKNGKALALPMMAGRSDGSGRIAGQKSLTGLGRSTPNGRGGFIVKPGRNAPARVTARVGKSIAPYKAVIFRQKVTHPGLVPRPFLPTDAQILPILEAAAKRAINLALASGQVQVVP